MSGWTPPEARSAGGWEPPEVKTIATAAKPETEEPGILARIGETVSRLNPIASIAQDIGASVRAGKPQIGKGGENLASLGDMLPGMITGALNSGLYVGNAAVGGVAAARGDLEGVSPKALAMTEEAQRKDVMGKIPMALQKPLSSVVNWINQNDKPSSVDELMGKLMEYAEQGSEKLERASGGRLLAEDTRALLDTVLNFGLGGAASGVKGFREGLTKPRPGAAPRVEPGWAPPEAAYAGRPKVPKDITDVGPAPAEPNAPTDAYTRWHEQKAEARQSNTADAYVNAEARAYDLMQRGASKREVEAAIKKDRLVGDYLAALRERRASVQEAETGAYVGGERGDFAGPLDGYQPDGGPSGPGQLPSNRPLLSGRNAAGAGAAAGLAYALTREDDDWLKAVAPMAAIPLGAALAKGRYTLKTFERLPQNRRTFTREQVEQQLNRPDAGKSEKTIIQEILGDKKEISAQELVEGFAKKAEKLELKPVETEQFAGYGVDAIGRKAHESMDVDAWADASPAERAAALAEGVPSRTTIYQSPVELGDANHFNDPNYFGHTRSFDEGGVRHVVEVQSDLAQKARKTLTPEERTGYESAVKQSEALLNKLNNSENAGRHFESPGWAETTTREFNALPQEGKSLVLSLMGKNHNGMSKALFAGEGAPKDFARGKQFLLDGINASDPVARASIRRAYNSAMVDFAGKLEVKIAEIRSKLKESTGAEEVRPILKDWSKRLIREEMTKAAEELPGKPVRFATADTVAKVEGWPDRGDGEIRRIQERIDGARANLERVTAEQRPDYENDIRKLEDAKAAYQRQGRFRPEHQSIYDRYQHDIEKFLTKDLGGKHVTDEQGHTWIEVPPTPTKGGRIAPTQMFGGADSSLMKAVALAGGAGALAAALSSEQNKQKNALLAASLTALAVFAHSRSPTVRKMTEDLLHQADYLGGNISDRIRNMSPALLRRLTDHELAVLQTGHKWIDRTHKFLDELDRLPNAQRRNLETAILQNNRARVDQLIGDNATLKAEWHKVNALLDEVGRELVGTGRLKKMRGDYFPRMVKDYEGLMEHLGVETKTLLEERLRKLDEESLRATGAKADPLERAQVINEYLSQRGGGSGRPGFLKQRGIEDLASDLVRYYHTPAESLHMYLRGAVKELERSKFFGKNAVRDPSGRINVQDSIGNVANSELASGKITPKQFEELRDILQSRFGPGERATPEIVQMYKNAVYATVLAHPSNAAAQLGDVLVPMMHGVLPYVKALGTVVTRSEQAIKVSDLGLINHIAEEMASASWHGKLVDRLLTAVGFTSLDKFVKTMGLNTSLKKMTADASTPRGVERLRRQWGEYMGEDFPQLVEDLRQGKRTELVYSALFRDLSDIQPLTKLENSQFVLDNPKLRGFVALKTFLMKQISIARNKIIGEWKRGNRTEAIRNGIMYGLAAGLGTTAAEKLGNLILGRSTETELSDIALNIFKVFGFSDYTIDVLRKEGPAKAAAQFLAPPVPLIDKAWKGDPSVIEGVPIVGRVINNRMMGGAERWEDRRLQNKLKNMKSDKEPTSEDVLEERKQRRHERLREKAEAAGVKP